MKNTFDGLTSKLDTVRERNSELEVGLIQTAQPEQGNNRWEKQTELQEAVRQYQDTLMFLESQKERRRSAVQKI